MEQAEYSVRDGFEGATVVVTGNTITVTTPTVTRVFDFERLVNDARRGALPGWVRQIPALTARIEERFRAERERGWDPHVRFQHVGDTLYRYDLQTGAGVGRPVAELKRRAAAGTLPRAFQDPRARELRGEVF